MKPRLILALSAIAVAITAFPILSGVGTAQTSPAVYNFEECEQGWTAVSDSALPLASAWTRAEPGRGTSMFAWHLVDDDVNPQDESLVSPPHTVAAGSKTVSYYLAYSLEEGDILAVEWKPDLGETWTSVQEYTGANAGYPEFVLGAATFTSDAGLVQIRFHFVGDGPQLPPAEGALSVDDVTITAPTPAEAACPTPSPSGSSTASPTTSPTASTSPSASPSPSPTPPPDDPRDCTIFGTDEDDTLSGTPGDDVICLYSGDDTVNGRGGNDKIYGDGGKDNLRGGGGKDNLKGGPANDLLRGGRGNDKHNGGGGKDTCTDTKGTNRFKSCEKH